MAKHTNGSTKIPDKVRIQNEEAEAIARAKAERLFAAPPVEAPATKATDFAEPTLEQRLADIDRRAKERAVEEKRQLAQHYVMEARNAFKRAVSNTTDEAVKKAYEEMIRLERMSEGAGGTLTTAARGDAVNNGVKTRERRSPESLAADAAKLVDYLRANPNSKGSAAVEATGVVVKQPLNVRTFIEKYAVGKVKVITEGQKAGTLYSVR